MNTELTKEELCILLTLNGNNYLPQIEGEIFSNYVLLSHYIQSIMRTIGVRSYTGNVIEGIVWLAVSRNTRWEQAEAYFDSLRDKVLLQRDREYIDSYKSHFRIYPFNLPYPLSIPGFIQ